MLVLRDPGPAVVTFRRRRLFALIMPANCTPPPPVRRQRHTDAPRRHPDSGRRTRRLAPQPRPGLSSFCRSDCPGSSAADGRWRVQIGQDPFASGDPRDIFFIGQACLNSTSPRYHLVPDLSLQRSRSRARRRERDEFNVSGDATSSSTLQSKSFLQCLIIIHRDREFPSTVLPGSAQLLVYRKSASVSGSAETPEDHAHTCENPLDSFFL